MLEAQALHRVVELDVDAEVVGIELELIVAHQRRVLVDIHDELGDLAAKGEPPMAIACGLRLKVDAGGHATQSSLGSPWAPPGLPLGFHGGSAAKLARRPRLTSARRNAKPGGL